MIEYIKNQEGDAPTAPTGTDQPTEGGDEDKGV
jgi:hypothetical protein